MRFILVLFLLTFLDGDVFCFDEGGFFINHRFDDGLIGRLSIKPGTDIDNGWNMVVTFSEPIKQLEVWQANIQKTNQEKTVFALKGAHWHRRLSAGNEFEFNFKVTTKRKGGYTPQILEVAVGRTEDERGLHCA